MNEERLSHRNHIILKFSSAPFILKLYCLFATFATIFGLAILFFGERSEAAIIGPQAPIGYMFGLYFIYTLIFSSDERINKRRLRLALILLLAIYSSSSIYMLLINSNPFRTVTAWLIFWMIILPIVWAILLMTKQVTRFVIRYGYLNE